MKSAATALVCGVLAFGVVGAAVTPTLAADPPTLRYRGSGKTREALDAMQLKPFDQTLWATLSDWTGAAPKSEDLNGKVVMVVTWASWYKLSHGAMRSAESLSQKYKDKGLVVVGVHNPRGYEGAAENAKTLGITFPFAADKDGKFRAGIRADQDPNIYFIDRAGNLRFAQVDPSSMEEAASYLVGETADAAKSFPSDLEKKRIEADKARWRTQDPSGVRPDQEPSVEFTEPEDDAYKATRWPYLVGKVETDQIFDKIKNDPPKVTGWPEDGWSPAAPKRAGKLVVVYYVDPKEVEMLNVLPTMNRLHDQYKRDVVVVLSLFKSGQNSLPGAGGNNGGGGEEDEKIVQRNREQMATILRTRSVNHFIIPRTIRYENLELGGGGMIPRLRATTEESGFSTILSSDLRVRWVGSPYDSDLKIALDKLIAVDPGVKARHKAEAAKGIK